METITIEDDGETFKNEYWLPALSLKKKSLEIMSNPKWMSDEEIDPFLDIIEKQGKNINQVFKPMSVFDQAFEKHFGDERTKMNPSTKFIALINNSYDTEQGESSFHSLGNHWITLSNVFTTNTEQYNVVALYDSLNLEKLTPDTIKYLRFMMHHETKRIKVVRMPVTHQQGSWSCGYHAVANSVSVALGYRPEKNDYESSELLQKHAKEILENQVLELFPVKEGEEGFTNIQHKEFFL